MAISKVSSSLHFVKETQNAAGREASSETYWVPNTDVYFNEKGLVIKVELSGIRREDLELTIDSHRLKINGYRADGCRNGKCTFLLMEINYGLFESVIEIPTGYDLSRAKAMYQNGFLRVDVPEQTRASGKIHHVPIASED
ncbi:MAG: Hsp20/alpha crystallin family protein [Limisphaerales bacterium]